MQQRNKHSVGVVLITHNSRHHLALCLPPLLASPLRPRLLVVNSSSCDGTIEEAGRLGAETLLIPRREFNHGLTREKARHYLGTEIVVMMTPDAYATEPSMLETLIRPIVNEQASISYAKQLPHYGANFLESFPRAFNYPDESQLRSSADLKKYGVYTFFCSNSCAAWSNPALDEIGGFRAVLTGEDTLAAAMLLERGHRIAYVADATVYHSHSYTALQELRRYFDTGYARNKAPLLQQMIAAAGRDECRGKALAKELLLHVAKQAPWLLPKTGLHLAAKWLGYRLGSSAVNAPLWIKKRLSSQNYYWS